MPALNQTAPLAPKSERTGAQPAAEKPARATAAPRVRQTITPPRRGTPATEAPQQAIGPGADTQASIDRALATLSRELRADAIFVLKDGALLTQRGNLPGLQVESVAGVLRRWASTAAELAAIVGENNSRFAQFHAEGERYHVYSYDTGSGLMLVVICRTDIPFGTLRLSLKAAGAQLAKLAR
jgi:predicted regulator of Ras-like GTPase activity (Roadblock/LC7/MglB family)